MNAILHLLNVNTVVFTIFNYPMSYVELFGTIFNLACVWLVARKNILNWPIGIIGVILFGALFYQIHLYADLFEQFYYFFTGFWGWYIWKNRRASCESGKDIIVKKGTLNNNIIWLVAILVFTAAGTWAMLNINKWLPNLFPIPAALPLLDVCTTIMSFAAQILMIQKRLESWILWIAVDVVAIWLYWYKGVPFVALLYLIFLYLATKGLLSWNLTYKEQNK